MKLLRNSLLAAAILLTKASGQQVLSHPPLTLQVLSGVTGDIRTVQIFVYTATIHTDRFRVSISVKEAGITKEFSQEIPRYTRGASLAQFLISDASSVTGITVIEMAPPVTFEVEIR